jgi:hypothetical protein
MIDVIGRLIFDEQEGLPAIQDVDRNLHHLQFGSTIDVKFDRDWFPTYLEHPPEKYNPGDTPYSRTVRRHKKPT